MAIPSWHPYGIPARRYATLYVCIAAPVLIALCFLTAPFQVPDEPAHFFRAVQLSQGRIAPIPAPGGHAAGGLVDAAAITLVDAINRDIAGFDATHRFTLAVLLADRGTERSGELHYAAFSNTVIYVPFEHLVPAVAIAAVRLFGVPPLAWVYAGRLANAAVALSASGLAILLFEESAIYAFAICLLPRVLFEQASLSVDAPAIAFALLFWALLLRLTRQEVTARTVAPAFLLATLTVCAGKFAYIPMAVLPPAVALLEWRRRTTVIVLAVVAALALAVWLAWALAIHNAVFPIGHHDGVVDPHEQLRTVLHDPFVFLAGTAVSLVGDMPTLLREMAGPNLGWIHRPILPGPIVLILLFTLAAAAMVRAPGAMPRATTRLVTLLALLASLIAIYLLLYLNFTPIGEMRVDGVQGRYLIPLIAAVPLLFPGLPIDARLRVAVQYVLTACSVLGALSTVVMVWVGYWHA
jgi:uncharacterized membrane protein